jgi:hypothetical protein
MRRIPGLILALAVPICSPRAEGQPVAIETSAGGLKRLEVGGRSFLADGAFLVLKISGTGPDGREVIESHGTGRLAGGTNGMDWVWTSASADVRCRYTATGSRLDLDIRVVNRSKELTLNAVMLQPMTLKFPSAVTDYNGVTPLMRNGIGHPPALTVRWSDGTMALCHTDPAQRPLALTLPWAADRPANTVFPVWVNTFRHLAMPTSWPVIERPVPPGQTQQYRVSLRFGPKGADEEKLAPDVLAAFREKHPVTLDWPDRRPIGSLFLSSAGLGSRTNPRGWWNDPAVDVTTRAGRAAFRERVLRYADQSVAILKRMNAQGMVTWDVEGQEYPHTTSYIGDPRKLGRLAPELDAVADEFFARFRRAGLRTGVCLRPQSLTQHRTGGWYQKESADPAAVLSSKVAYARERWGCTLFYVDSNGEGPSLPYDAAVFRRVAREHPDVLLMPEHETAAYYAVTAPYNELRMGVPGTPDPVRRVFPRGFGVLQVGDGDLAKYHDVLVRQVRAGDILMSRTWWPAPENDAVRAIYREAAEGGTGRSMR